MGAADGWKDEKKLDKYEGWMDIDKQIQRQINMLNRLINKYRVHHKG